MKMWKYFTEYNTRKYIDVIHKLLKSYNHTYHRSIKMEPVSVTIDNQAQVWKNLYGSMSSSSITPVTPFQVGDNVRISKTKGRFEKGYEQNWTYEIFVVDKIIHRTPPVYKVKDLQNEEIQGTFYAQELQKVTKTDYFQVEKILKKRKTKKKTEYFVKFKGYPEKFNAWVSDVTMI